MLYSARIIAYCIVTIHQTSFIATRHW